MKLALRVLYIAKLTPQDHELMNLSYKNVVHRLALLLLDIGSCGYIMSLDLSLYCWFYYGVSEVAKNAFGNNPSLDICI